MCIIRVQGFTPPVLVFIQSKERGKELFRELIYDGINVEVIHADRTQAERDNIIKSFRAGRVSQCIIHLVVLLCRVEHCVCVKA